MRANEVLSEGGISFACMQVNLPDFTKLSSNYSALDLTIILNHHLPESVNK